MIDAVTEETVVVTGVDIAEQAVCETVTVKVFALFTTILCVVAPLLHRYPNPGVAVSVTLSPVHKLTEPEGVITAAAAPHVIFTIFEVVSPQPAVSVTITE